VLGELGTSERCEAEAHAAACSACRDELAQIRLTLDALSTLREEEIPRRIAFVSDKIFEPRWWQAFLRPSFAAGCVVAAAILVHAFVRQPAAALAPVDTAQIEARIEAQLGKRLNAAVEQAVARVEREQSEKTREMLAATERRYAEQRKADFATAAQNYEMLLKQMNRMYAVNTGAGVGQ
jgi:hypothetical protein